MKQDWKLGLLGYPLGHSLSAVMHEAALQALGCRGEYRAVEVAEAELESHVRALRDGSVDGWNVTVPYKQTVLSWVDEVDELASEVGAANVLSRSEAGRVVAHNTDMDGLARMLAGWGDAGGAREVVVLGAGGAARAAGFVASRFAERVTFVNRHVERARSVAADVVSSPQSGSASFGVRSWPRRAADREELTETLACCDLLIHATSVMESTDRDWRGFRWDALPPTARILDLVYRREPTYFVRLGARLGLPARDGRGMLLYQAARALEIWLGTAAPVEVMADALGVALGCSGAEVTGASERGQHAEAEGGDPPAGRAPS